MKSKLTSSRICRAKSPKKIAAPLSTPTRTIGWPAKSRVICAPISATFFAISCREINTFNARMANHNKLEGGKEREDMDLKGIKITWLGHATFRIETPSGKIILLDPWVMGNPMCPEKRSEE